MKSDWHIHSHNSCDQASLTVADLVEGVAREGVSDYGLSDHIHTAFNMPDLEASRREYLSVDPSSRFHFGVEASCVSQWEIDEVASGRVENPVYGVRKGGPPGGPLAIALNADDIERLGIAYVIGGTHWPMYVELEREAVIRDYHRQNMFLATHPLVDIVAHPWWWGGRWTDGERRFDDEPWLGDFRRIPPGMHDEFAAAARESGKIVEINLGAIVMNPQYPERFRIQYLDYLAQLKAQGVTLSLGSDCHQSHYDADMETAAGLLETVGISDRDMWTLPPRTSVRPEGAQP